MNRRLIVTGSAAVALLLALVLFMVAGESSEQRELREFKAKLVAAGEKLTIEEVTSGKFYNNTKVIEQITNLVPQLNAVRFAPGEITLMEGPGSVMDMDPPPGHSGRRMLNWAEINSRLAEAEPSLSELKTLLDREPEPWVTRTNPIASSSPFVALRTAAQWLAVAAVAEARAGQLTNSLRSLRCLANLARSNGEDRTLVAAMIRIALARLGLSTTWEILHKEGWTGEQVAEISRIWQEVRLLEILEEGWLGERAFGSWLWKIVDEEGLRGLDARLGPFPGSVPGLSRFRYVPITLLHDRDADQLLHLKAYQESLERCRAVIAREGAALALWRTNQVTSVLDKSGKLRAYRYWISAIAIPNMSRATETTIQAEAQRQVTLAALALMRWKLEHGKPARSLEEAAGAYGLDLYDPYTGKGLLCRESVDGLVPYCLGEDLKDDGGHPASDKPWRTKHEPK